MLRSIPVLNAQVLFFHFASLISATPLHLIPATHLNLVTSSTATLPFVNATFVVDNTCFEHRSNLYPAKYLDCVAAIDNMSRGKATQPCTFSRGRPADVKLPKNFSSGSCLVTLDMVYDDQIDTVTFSDIRDRALALAFQCTRNPIHDNGGVAPVGPMEILYITIIGLELTSVS